MDDELKALVEIANATIRGERRKPRRGGLITRAVRAELTSLGVDLASSALARTAVDVAQRLDLGPTDRDFATLSRELRLVVDALYRRHGSVGGDELDGFLKGISNPAFGNGPN